MKELNFKFPVVRNMEITKMKQKGRVKRLKSLMENEQPAYYPSFDEWEIKHVFDSEATPYYREVLVKEWKNQALVGRIKHAVNKITRKLIKAHLKHYAFPEYLETAYYVLCQKAVDKRMEEAARMIYEELV